MKKEEKASISVMKIICISIILILISGISVMAVNTNLKDVKVVLQNGYEMTVLTSKNTVEEILAENNIVLEENQKTIPDSKEKIDSGATIKIVDKSYNEVQISNVSKNGTETTLDQLLTNYTTITEKIVIEQEEIPYETITQNTAGTTEDTTNKVVQEGENGIKQITYKVKYQNNVEIEKTKLSEEVIKEPVNKIIQINKVVTSRAATLTRDTNTNKSATASATAISTGNGTWTYSNSDIDLLCAITAQECGSSYTGALAVITTACNRAEARGSDPLTQYKAPGQFCYSLDSNWKNKLNGNYPAYVKQAVQDALNGTRNHEYYSFRTAGTHSGTLIGGNVYF